MRETVAIKDGDRFMTISEHGEDRRAPRTFGNGETQFYGPAVATT
jgi:hypothetical protein